MSIHHEITERLGLGADDGTDMKLVEVIGSKGVANLALGKETARRMVVREGVRDTDIVDVEFAGRGDHGDPVFLVTWRTAWSA